MLFAGCGGSSRAEVLIEAAVERFFSAYEMADRDQLEEEIAPDFAWQGLLKDDYVDWIIAHRMQRESVEIIDISFVFQEVIDGIWEAEGVLTLDVVYPDWPEGQREWQRFDFLLRVYGGRWRIFGMQVAWPPN